jgi:hypothetical protein
MGGDGSIDFPSTVTLLLGLRSVIFNIDAFDHGHAEAFKWRYSACGSVAAECKMVDDPPLLQVRGVIVDTIQSLTKNPKQDPLEYIDTDFT